MKPAECLEGLTLDGQWKVVSMIRPTPHSTGGCFSVGYIVEDSNGRPAYLKALDFSMAFQTPDFARELQSMTTAYNFERDLLSKCKDNKLHRVVTPLEDGTVAVPGNFGPLGNVCYLIFESAKGDIRNEVAALNAFDLAWCLRSLHQTAVGLKQLHSVGIAHQDLKPSNVLVFAQDGAKIADLGRASYVNVKSDIDKNQIPGDVGYAPPEHFYNSAAGRDFSERYLADLYMLGSLVFFYFSNCSATQAMQAKIKGFKGINFTNTDFKNDLAYIRQAFHEAVNDLKNQVESLAGSLTDEIMGLVMQLCEPDPSRRGDPKTFGTLSPQHNLERYISRLDLLAWKAEKKIL